MRLAEIVIRNFKGINELKLKLPHHDPARPGSANFLTLIGENNRCKSSVLEAIRLAFPDTDLKKPSLDHFHHRSIEKGAIEIDLTFDSIKDAEAQRIGIKPYLYDGRNYRIRKKWHAPDKMDFEVYIPERTVPDFDGIRNLKRAEIMERSPDWRDALTSFETSRNKLVSDKKITVKDFDEFELFVKNTIPHLCKESDPQWQKNPGGFPANVDSAMPRVIFVPAVRDVEPDANPASKGGMANKLLGRIFERSISTSPQISALKTAIGELRKLFDGDGVDSVEEIRRIQQSLSDKMRRLIEVGVKIDYVPPDLTASLFHSATLSMVDGGLSTSPLHQGHGAQRALFLTLLEVYAEQLHQKTEGEEPIERGVILLVEEPEIYLHPQMCRRMRDVLLDIARTETGQVICTTHSPVFIDLADRHDGIAILKRSETGVDVVQRDHDIFAGSSDERDRLRMLLDFDPSVTEVFFAKQICLVEGDSEVASIWAITKKLAQMGFIEFERVRRLQRDLCIVNCRGKDTIPAFQRVLNAFELDYRVVHDSDSDKRPTSMNRQIFENLKHQEKRRLVHTPNFEKCVWNEAWDKDKMWKATLAIMQAKELAPRLATFYSFVHGQNPYIDECIKNLLLNDELNKTADYYDPQEPLPLMKEA